MNRALRNFPFSVPTTREVDYASLRTPEQRRAYFQRNGYVVRPDLVTRELCATAVATFEEEVKQYPGYLYRQATANPERNLFDSAGRVVNSILNPLSVNRESLGRFRTISEQMLSQDALFDAVEELYGEPATLVQSMYFEGNPATWPHQDCYYLDSDRTGSLLGAWIAVEDIHEAAGRFYIVPGSHELFLGNNIGALNIAHNHERYKQTIHRAIQEKKLELRAPPLKRGDVLLWGSRTVHGALSPSDNRYARNSYTAHFIPSSSRFIQYQCIPLKLYPSSINGHAICRPKDQNRWLNRAILNLEALLPKPFHFAKREAIAWKIRRHNQSRET